MKVILLLVALSAFVSAKLVICRGAENDSHRWAFCTKMVFGDNKMAHWTSSAESSSQEVTLKILGFSQFAWRLVMLAEDMGHATLDFVLNTATHT
jgi:hypothetical protein